MRTNLEHRYAKIMASIEQDKQLARYVNADQPIPIVHRGTGPIRLIILGQDPTVKDAASRTQITYVLNLNRSGALHNYIQRICLDLALDLNKNLYATNYVKNFFAAPPTQIAQIDVLAGASRYWLPLLRDELAEFPNVPIISLGQPLLEHIVTNDASPLVRDYWDYQFGWQLNPKRHWKSLAANQNTLHRTVFPFPHQPSLRKQFYRDHLRHYLQFVKKHMGALG